MKEFKIKKLEAGERIDSFLAKNLPSHSRSIISNSIKAGLIKVNGMQVKPSYAVKENDCILAEEVCEETSTELEPSDIDLNIIFEDKDVIVLNKQPGISVHPGAGNKAHSIANALVRYFPKIREAVFEKGNEISELRPGIVHRLDKGTSGVMIVAKNSKAIHSLSRQIQNRTVSKTYLALCCGWPKQDSGQLTNYLGRHPKNRKIIADIGSDKGKKAISDFKVNKYLSYDQSKLSLIEFKIHTGRTHQIRVQSKIIGNPVLGDEMYGNKDSIKLSKTLGIKRQLLHAHKLEITLPSKKRPEIFIAPLPEDFLDIICKLKEE